MSVATGSGSGAVSNCELYWHLCHRHRRLGLIHHVEDVERVPAERIGGRRSGIDRRQIGLIGTWFGVRRHLAIAIGRRRRPPRRPRRRARCSSSRGLGMFRHAFDMHLGRLSLRRRPAQPPPRLPAPAVPPRGARHGGGGDGVWRRRSASSAVSPATAPAASSSASASASASARPQLRPPRPPRRRPLPPPRSPPAAARRPG